jgi:hypothetical protein
MNKKGYDRSAKICLTHSFPYKDINSFSGNNDCTNDEVKKLEIKLNQYEYDDYDKLIQLCDAICMAEGVCLLEVRLIDIVRRHKIYGREILNKWDAFFEIKAYFSNKCGMNIYRLFYDEIIKNCIQ